MLGRRVAGLGPKLSPVPHTKYQCFEFSGHGPSPLTCLWLQLVTLVVVGGAVGFFFLEKIHNSKNGNRGRVEPCPCLAARFRGVPPPPLALVAILGRTIFFRIGGTAIGLL